MFELFKNLDSTIQAAIITTIGAILCAIIAGIFGLKKKVNSANNSNIKQKQKGKNNIQIEVQNNFVNGDKKDE